MLKYIVRLENGLGFLAVMYWYVILDFPLSLFFLLLFVPDLTILGYLFNKDIGAKVYNIGHSFISPICFAAYCLYFSNDHFLSITLIWLAHIFMDRCFGFGLKYLDSFKHTHLQRF